MRKKLFVIGIGVLLQAIFVVAQKKLFTRGG